MLRTIHIGMYRAGIVQTVEELTTEIYAAKGHGSAGVALTYLHGLRKVYPQAATEQRDEEAG